MHSVPGFLLNFWLHWFWMIAFPVEQYLYIFHARRIRRGVIHRWLYRNWGPGGPLLAHMMLFMLVFLSVILLFVDLATPLPIIPDVQSVVIATFWTLYVGWAVIDYITGGDDPGKRVKKLVSSLVKKLKIAPAPRPVIDLR